MEEAPGQPTKLAQVQQTVQQVESVWLPELPLSEDVGLREPQDRLCPL